MIFRTGLYSDLPFNLKQTSKGLQFPHYKPIVNASPKEGDYL
jgi:hypothetical protein